MTETEEFASLIANMSEETLDKFISSVETVLREI